MPRLLRFGQSGGDARPPEADDDSPTATYSVNTAEWGAAPLEAPAPLETEGFVDRGRLRRRLRYLRRVRELALRDLGGLIFELHHRGRAREDLVAAKLGTLTAIHDEIGTLEQAMDARQPVTVLREAGLAACISCGTLHGSDANFCPNCGRAIGGPPAAADAEGVPAAPAPPADVDPGALGGA
jgi:hypothetical protein